jgi:hypothetical protein
LGARKSFGLAGGEKVAYEVVPKIAIAMKTQREIEIDAYIKDHPRAKLPAPLSIVYHGKAISQ